MPRIICFAAGLCIAGLIASPAHAVNILDVDFDSMTIDAPCPTGGAAMNEPHAVTFAVIGTVRSAPFPTPCVEIADNHEGTSGWISFQFMNDAEITGGTVTMSLDLWIPTGMDNNVTVSIREPNFASQSFLNMNFTTGGDVHVGDAAGTVGTVATYSYDQAMTIELIFDMDARTYDIELDDALIVDDRAHGILDRGIGSILVTNSHDLGFDGMFYVDNVSADVVGFTPARAVSWAGVKAAF